MTCAVGENMLAAAIIAAGMPVRLTEIGTSAGLNLRADAFHLEAGGESDGPADAPVRRAPDWRGPTQASSRWGGRQ